ncbi:MAG: M23 family metallopeptidase [Clostridia bacterium]|nr:M23 family metallopeptidase [Clostridia bacterium]
MVKNEVIKDPVNEIIVVGTKNVYVTSAPQNASSSGFKWPLSTVGVLTSTYGEVRNNGTKIHGALDIAVPQGTSVIAVKGGTVVEAAYESGYGNYVVIDHGNGLKTLYAHNKRIVVSKGQKVTAGQLIALSGNTGRSTGPHLHFEVILNGNTVNPGNYLDMSKFK